MAKKANEQIDAPAEESPAVPSIPGKFFYVGELYPYGPYRGFTVDQIADAQGITTEEGRKDFLDNLKAW